MGFLFPDWSLGSPANRDTLRRHAVLTILTLLPEVHDPQLQRDDEHLDCPVLHKADQGLLHLHLTVAHVKFPSLISVEVRRFFVRGAVGVVLAAFLPQAELDRTQHHFGPEHHFFLIPPHSEEVVEDGFPPLILRKAGYPADLNLTIGRPGPARSEGVLGRCELRHSNSPWVPEFTQPHY